MRHGIKEATLLLAAFYAVSAAATPALFNGNVPAPADIPDWDTFYQSYVAQADLNETSEEIAALVWKANALMLAGDFAQARNLLEPATVAYSDSRHLHKMLAEVLWYQFQDEGKELSILHRAGEAIVNAVTLGLSFGRVEHTWLMAQILGRIDDRDRLETLFAEALALEPAAEIYLDYALGLSLLEDSRAEEMYRIAMERSSGGNVSALAKYGEWLLDQGREDEALALLPESTEFSYLHFLRGVALERLGRLAAAESEYHQFTEFSRAFPAPARYRIPGSVAQKESGIRFQRVRQGFIEKITSTQAITGLSTLIWGEARGESVGGQRAEGWVARNRVLRGSVGSPSCPYVTNSGATLADKYKSVMCQSGQFIGICAAWCSNPATTSCSTDATTNQSAYDVYWGYAPDPVAAFCPGGLSIWGGTWCSTTTKCKGSSSLYSTAGGLFNIGTSGTCPTHFCAPTNKGKVCGNGLSDNCFYTNP